MSKQIYIQTRNTDFSSVDVIEWMNHLYHEVDILQINNTVPLDEILIRISNEKDYLKLSASHGNISLDNIRSFWYRRGVFPSWAGLSGDGLIYPTLKFVNNHIVAIHSILEGMIERLLTYDKPHLNKPSDNRTNKIENLLLAKKAGLNIPDTLITNKFEEVRLFFNKWGKIITKPIGDLQLYFPLKKNNNVQIFSSTKLVTADDLKEIQAETTVPALFQAYIEKDVELRVFYLQGAFYAMAIFSQQSDRTKVDYRMYDRETPNRCVPYKLPKNVQLNLDRFMKAIDMNCGSIDLILTPNGTYVFLEVNPIGQYQWLEYNCNYPISRKIAEYLIKQN